MPTRGRAVGAAPAVSPRLFRLCGCLGARNERAPPWRAWESGTTWNGPAAKALNGGSGAGLLAGDGGHLAFNLMSPHVCDGVLQAVVMGPKVTPGDRKQLTLSDLAIRSYTGATRVCWPLLCG